MIGALLKRAAYVRFLFRPGVWRWFVHSVDYLVADHLLAWAHLGKKPHSMVHPSVSFRSGHNVLIESHTRIQNGCVLWASPNSKIRIGKYSGLGPGTKIFSSNHEYTPGVPYHQQAWREEDVTIGDDVWVGAGTIIVAGVTIGSGSVIAAGSVVTRNIPSGSVAAGVPAKVIKSR